MCDDAVTSRVRLIDACFPRSRPPPFAADPVPGLGLGLAPAVQAQGVAQATIDPNRHRRPARYGLYGASLQWRRWQQRPQPLGM